MGVTHRNIDEELLPGAWVTQSQLHHQKALPKKGKDSWKLHPRGSLSGFQKAWLAAEPPFPNHCYCLFNLRKDACRSCKFQEPPEIYEFHLPPQS